MYVYYNYYAFKVNQGRLMNSLLAYYCKVPPIKGHFVIYFSKMIPTPFQQSIFPKTNVPVLLYHST